MGAGESVALSTGSPLGDRAPVNSRQDNTTVDSEGRRGRAEASGREADKAVAVWERNTGGAELAEWPSRWTQHAHNCRG